MRTSQWKCPAGHQVSEEPGAGTSAPGYVTSTKLDSRAQLSQNPCTAPSPPLSAAPLILLHKALLK